MAPVVHLQEFLPDTRRIGRGVQVSAGDWRAQLDENKQAFALEFVQRARFLADFPASMTGAEFVARLDANAGGVLTADERAQLVASLGATPAEAAKRAAALRQMAEHAQLRQREFDRAFVLMQFYRAATQLRVADCLLHPCATYHTRRPADRARI